MMSKFISQLLKLKQLALKGNFIYYKIFKATMFFKIISPIILSKNEIIKKLEYKFNIFSIQRFAILGGFLKKIKFPLSYYYFNTIVKLLYKIFLFFNKSIFKLYQMPKWGVDNFFKNKINSPFYTYINSFFVFFYKISRYWFLAVIVFWFYIKNIISDKFIQIGRNSFVWFTLFMIIYWLLSGFIFFIKKYQYSKFTASIQRFWKRSYVIFWSLEFFLFIIFIFFYVNTTTEPQYFHTQQFRLKFQIISWEQFFFKALIQFALIVMSYNFLLKLKHRSGFRYSIELLVISYLLSVIFFVEFYQFQYVISYYNRLFWTYNASDFEDLGDGIWVQAFASNETLYLTTSVVTNYWILILIAKFWHILFIYIVTMFTISRYIETGSISYITWTMIHQNFIILFIFYLFNLIPFFKFYLKSGSINIYFWFFVDTHKEIFKIILNDLYWLIN